MHPVARRIARRGPCPYRRVLPASRCPLPFRRGRRAPPFAVAAASFCLRRFRLKSSPGPGFGGAPPPRPAFPSPPRRRRPYPRGASHPPSGVRPLSCRGLCPRRPRSTPASSRRLPPCIERARDAETRARGRDHRARERHDVVRGRLRMIDERRAREVPTPSTPRRSLWAVSVGALFTRFLRMAK